MDAGVDSSAAHRQRPLLSVDTRRVEASTEEPGEPLSPTARLFQDIFIVAVFGFGTPIDFGPFRAGLEATLLQHPRFRSIQVMDGPDEPRWVQTTVSLDDHLVIPDLDPTAISANPDKVLEEYVASLSTLPMNLSRPLWELHVLNFPTSESKSAVVFRIHHALGDGTSLLSLVLACTRSAADPKALPAMPAPPRRTGPIYSMPRPTRPAGAVASFAAWVSWCLLLAWHTVVDVARFVTSVMLVSDPRTVFTGGDGARLRGKRFVSRGLSFADVKRVKNALGCTVNDVLVGVTSAALSRYHFRKLATTDACLLRTILAVNIRPTPGLPELAKMMENGKDNHVKWGNQVGYIVLPLYIAMHDDPLEYIRKAKKIVDRKKNSLEAIFTHVAAEAMTRYFGVKVSGDLFHRMEYNTTFAFSSLSGPVEQIEFYGHPVVYIAPSFYGNPTAVNLLWQSYGDTIRIVLAVDDAKIPDPHQLLDDFAESLRTIREATSTAL